MKLPVLLIATMVFSLFAGAVFAEDRAFQRVQKSLTLNCGVYVLGSIFSYDNKGKPQGFTVDLFEEVSKRTGLDVKYKEISSFGTLFEDLNTGHYDLVCAPLLALPATIMHGLPGIYIKQDPISIYADEKTDISKITTLETLNDPQYRFVGMEGELGGLYVPKLFPKATLNLLAQGSPAANMFLEIKGNKADFIVLSSLAANAYETSGTGKLQRVTDQPIINSSVRIFYAQDSLSLKANIDAVIEDIQRDGTLDALLVKHGLN
jgi:ABC-type amino acid transport substrate-binding protein